MSEVLSQSEIEDLLSDMAAEESGAVASEDNSELIESVDERLASRGQTALPRAGDQSVILPLSRRRAAAMSRRDLTIPYEPYDFRRSDKLSKEHIRTLQVIHENFARLFTSSISAYLRSPVQVDLISVDQVIYDEFIRSISASLINVLGVSPLSGQALLELDLRIVFALLDRLLGGSGDVHVKAGKDLTDVEKVLARSVVKRALTELANAWHDIAPLEFAVESVENSAQFLQIVPGNDTIVLMLFDIRFGEHQGAMSLSIPYMLLKPLADRLHTQRWFSSAKRSSHALAPKMASRLREMTRIPCVARLGTSEITVDTLANLEVGQILPLNLAEGNTPPQDGAGPGLAFVDLLVGDRPKFRGHIGGGGGKRLAVQIDDVIQPPPLLEVHKELPS